jgi:hypothetical protein
VAKPSASVAPTEFRTMEAYLRHFYPKSRPATDDMRDICATAQHLATETVRTVRRQLKKR